MSEEEMIAQMRYVCAQLMQWYEVSSLVDRTLLLAGYETTATSLSWLLLEIARHTDVQTRLRNEIHEKEREIWARGDVEFTANDFDSMPYLTAVIKVNFLIPARFLGLNPEFLNRKAFATTPLRSVVSRKPRWMLFCPSTSPLRHFLGIS
jgi:hypothetical protein